ncbi:FISUMP domain-containing protein [Fibrobacter sp.]|uniref:FISUMP domain-containing protein n=1 Tax=Fibrobacter sp. TaxID=35828 RepID=UPI00388EC2E9
MRKSILALTISSLFSIAFVACGDSGADAGDSNNSNWKKDSSSDPSVLIDVRDGEQYRTVRIGNQLWMAENLRFYDTLWSPTLPDYSEADEYGRLYTYGAAMAGRDYIDSGYNDGICPVGWHLPSMAEFDVLKNFVSEFCPSVDSCLRSTEGWNFAGNDRFGFNAKHSSETNIARYWTSNSADAGMRINTDHGYTYRSNSSDAVMYVLRDSYGYDTFGAEFAAKGNLFYVRCVKGSEVDSAAYMDNYLKGRENMIEYLSSSAAYQAYLSSSSAAEWARVQQGAKKYFNPDLNYGEFVDTRDGQTYGYLQIGNYTWMAENMRYFFKGLYNSYCEEYLGCVTRFYADTVKYFQTGLYYPDTLLDEVCPAGWHVPSKLEWQDLLDVADGSGNLLADDGNWVSQAKATNSTGFTAITTTSNAKDPPENSPFNAAWFWIRGDSVSVTYRLDTAYIVVDTLVPVPVDTVGLDSSDVDVEPAPAQFMVDTVRVETKYHMYFQYEWVYNAFQFKVTTNNDYSYVRCVKDY